MTLTVDTSVIKHDAWFQRLRDDIRNILDVTYQKTFVGYTTRRIVEAVRLLAEQALFCQKRIDEVVTTFTHCLRTNRELHFTHK